MEEVALGEFALDAFHGGCVVIGVYFDAHEAASGAYAGDSCRAAAHVGIEHRRSGWDFHLVHTPCHQLLRFLADVVALFGSVGPFPQRPFPHPAMDSHGRFSISPRYFRITKAVPELITASELVPDEPAPFGQPLREVIRAPHADDGEGQPRGGIEGLVVAFDGLRAACRPEVIGRAGVLEGDSIGRVSDYRIDAFQRLRNGQRVTVIQRHPATRRGITMTCMERRGRSFLISGCIGGVHEVKRSQ